MTSSRLRYLPGLDGLRALFVLAVLLYHAGYGWASGGFLGVSGFFTLSGFLITTLLLREYEETGRLDVLGFWLRRARRLVPALIVAAIGILVFAATVASGLQADSVADDGPWAMLYLANWRFIVEGQEYADLFNGDATSPLLHLWSLAIEEQFYLVLPLVAVVCARGGRLRRNLAIAASVGVVGSLGATIYFAVTGADLSRAYYGTDTRAAELLIGVLGAIALDRRRAGFDAAASRRMTVAGVASLAVMATLWGSASETTDWLRHGGLALHALLTLLVIRVAIAPGLLASMLTGAPLVALGRISYGVYIFHWPIYLWLTPERTGADGLSLTAGRLVVTFGVAALSHKVVELPVRSRRVHVGPLPVGILAMIAALFATLPASARPSTALVFEAVQAPEQVVAASIAAQSPERPREPAEAPATVQPIPVPPPPTRVMLVGDSVMLTLGRGFEQLALERPDLEVLNAAKIGCPIGEGGKQRIHGREVDELDHCAHQLWNGLLDTWKPDVVVVLSGVWDLKERRLDAWDSFLAPGDEVYDAWLLGEYQRALAHLGSRGADVVLVRPACLHREDQNGNPVEVDEFTPGRLDAYMRAVIDPLSAKFPLLDLSALVCPVEATPTSFALAELGGNTRPDGVHFSEAGSHLVAQSWLPELLALTD